MNRWKGVLKSASGIFAVIPGLGILITNIGVPPDCSKFLFSGIVEALGVFTLLVLNFNSESFKSFNNKKINRLSIGSILIFLISLGFYLFIFNEYVVVYKTSKAVFFPFWPQGEVKKGLDHFGSKIALIDDWGRDDVFNEIASSSSIMLTYTMLIFLFIYQLIFVSLTFAFGLLSFRVSESEKKNGSKRK